MDALLQPNTGLIIWTIVTFVCLVLVLKKAAWKPILSGLESRENKIKSDLERAEKANKDAEALRLKFEDQLAEAQRTIQRMMIDAKADGEKTRNQILSTAREESERILEKGRRDLANESDRLKQDLRNDVAGLAIQLAEKALGQALEPKLQEKLLGDSLKDIVGGKR